MIGRKRKRRKSESFGHPKKEEGGQEKSVILVFVTETISVIIVRSHICIRRIIQTAMSVPGVKI